MNCLQLHWPVHPMRVMPNKRQIVFISFHHCCQTALTTCAANILQSPSLVIYIVAEGNYTRPVGCVCVLVVGTGGRVRAPWSHIPVTLQRPAAFRWPLAALVHLLHGSTAQAALGCVLTSLRALLAWINVVIPLRPRTAECTRCLTAGCGNVG